MISLFPADSFCPASQRDVPGLCHSRAVPTTDWGSPETLEQWRKNWCDLCNAKFEEKGLDTRIDWRSYERQKANITTLKDVAEATIYLEENHIATLEQLEEKLNELRDHVSDLSDSMNEKSARMKKLKEAIRQASVYQEKLPDRCRETGRNREKISRNGLSRYVPT